MKGGSASVYAVAHPKKKTTQRLVTSKLRIAKLAKPNSSKCIKSQVGEWKQFVSNRDAKI